MAERSEGSAQAAGAEAVSGYVVGEPHPVGQRGKAGCFPGKQGLTHGSTRAHGGLTEPTLNGCSTDAEPDLPLDVIVLAILAGCSPRAVELAYAEREYRRADPVAMLAKETGVPLTLLAELADRWGVER